MESFGHSYAVAAPAAKIFAHLVRPESYIGLSPLVVAVRDVRHEGDKVSYVSVERFTFGPLKWDNPIKVTMTPAVPDRRLVSDVISPGRVRLTATVELVPISSGTQVTETIEVSSPALLRGFVLGQARSVQRARATELTRRMTAPA
ncbi:MAG: SRPBCC family protein [Actinoplanes sp.]